MRDQAGEAEQRNERSSTIPGVAADAARLVLEALNIGLWDFDPAMSSARWDEATYRLFGLNAKDHPNPVEAWSRLLEPAVREAVLQRMDRALREGGDFDVTYEITPPGAARRFVFVRGTVPLDGNGRPLTKVYGIAQDRTVEHLRERELEELRVQREEALARERKSARRFRSLFENSPVGISLINREGQFLVVNPAYCQMLGYTEEELREVGVPAVVPPDVRPFLREVLGDIMRTETTLPVHEATLIHKSGREVLTRITSRATTDEGGAPLLISLCEDISEVRRHEGEKARLLQEKEEIFRSARFSIVTTDLNGVITGFSQEAERLTGRRAADVVGSASPPFLHDPAEIEAVARELSAEYGIEVEPGFETFVCKARRGGHDERVWHVTNLRGETFPVLLNVTGLRDRHGALFGFMAVGKDISEEVRARAEAESERLRSAHSAKLASLGEMAGGIAHEVNNPLAIIQLASVQLGETLADATPDLVRARQLADNIERTTMRIATIVKGLKNFSRDGGREPLRPFAVAGVVTDTVSFCAERLKHAEVDLRIDPIDPELLAYGREVQISQVLLNLLNNASDAVAHAPDKWVRITARGLGREVELRVSDSGAGVPPTLRKKIFEPFFTTKDVGKGTGMGLSISVGIVKGHGGELYLEDGRPTCFVVRLPSGSGPVA